MDQQIIRLFDAFTHQHMERDEFLRKLATITGSMAAALALLPTLQMDYSKAETISQNDQELETSYVTWAGKDCTMKGYLALPKNTPKTGTVLIIHENRGLNPHIEDVARRAAKAGWIALAPDALSPFGGTPADENEARSKFSQINPEQNLTNFVLGLDFLRKHPKGNGKTACIGFCWGGAMSNSLAVADPNLQAAVAFYGRQAPVDQVPNIKAALQLHYAALDERINAGHEAYAAALKEHNKYFEAYFYEGVNHAFHNNTSTARYNEAAAVLAWQRSMDFLKKFLKA
jgi:carboxymethylenebutenolidase